MHSVHVATLKGGNWHYSYQPVIGLSYEVNIRG